MSTHVVCFINTQERLFFSRTRWKTQKLLSPFRLLVETQLIPQIKSISEEFCCPICFDVIKDCRITSCGMASQCICSQQDTTSAKNVLKSALIESAHVQYVPQQQLSDNCMQTSTSTDCQVCHFGLHSCYPVGMIAEEKEKASREYFEKLIGGSQAPQNSSSNLGLQLNQKLSPIEEIFHNYMKKSLLNYESYYQVTIFQVITNASRN